MMFEVRLKELLDPDRHFRVRLCMRVGDIPANEVVPGSVEDTCGECDTPIWVDLSQPVPPAPEGIVFEGDVVLCLPCLLKFHMLSEEPPTLLE